MASYRAIANGNWSNLAIWQDNSSGSFLASSVLPGPLDDVYSNSFIVQIDVSSINVNKLTASATTSITNGGRFELAINATIQVNNVIEGNLSATGSPINLVTNGTLYIKSAVTATIIGNIYGGTQGRYGVTCDNASNITIIGNQQGAVNVNNAAGLLSTSNATFNITGNQIGGSGSSSGNSHGILSLGAAILNITGNQIGGNNSTAAGISNSGGGQINITGNQTANTGPALSNTAAINIYINGTATATGINAIQSTNASSVVIYTGNIVNVNGVNAIYSQRLYYNIDPLSTYTFQDFSGVQNILYPASALPNVPATTDVRNGVTYASGALTGTLVVPLASAVTDGVIFDNGTIGTAQNTAASFLAELAVSTDPLAERLRNVSTVDTTAATIAAYNS